MRVYCRLFWNKINWIYFPFLFRFKMSSKSPGQNSAKSKQLVYKVFMLDDQEVPFQIEVFNLLFLKENTFCLSIFDLKKKNFLQVENGWPGLDESRLSLLEVDRKRLFWLVLCRLTREKGRLFGSHQNLSSVRSEKNSFALCVSSAGLTTKSPCRNSWRRKIDLYFVWNFTRPIRAN